MRSLCMSLLLIVGTLSGIGYSQGSTSRRVDDVRIDDAKPTVYLSVERKDEQTLRCRLYNNTTWAISVRTVSYYFKWNRTLRLSNGISVYSLPTDDEIESLHYYIEKEPTAQGKLKAPELHYGDSSATSWIPPRESITFSVPAIYLRPGLVLYVPFNYEWELSNQMIFGNEPEHRVYFRGVDLPKKSITSSK